MKRGDFEAALPDLARKLRLSGLSGRILIQRDHLGIAHVQAECEEDAFFGQGFACAQDRLWHMDYDRRRALGRWAEVIGPGGLESDLLMRKMMLEDSARRDYEHLEDRTRRMLRAYAAGVNAFADSADSLPAEYGFTGTCFEKWEPWHSLAVFKVRHVMMGVWEQKMFRARLLDALGPERASRFFAPYKEGDPLILPPGEPYMGSVIPDAHEEFSRATQAAAWLVRDEQESNNWVVAGDRTASGAPLVAGDPHRAPDVPNVYYQNHVACGEFDVIGFSFPGVPGFPHFGYGREVAWCITHTGADYQDLYVEKFRGGGAEYLFCGRWLGTEVKEEAVEVAGCEPVTVTVTRTHHGPVVAGDPRRGYALSFRYSATCEPNPTFNCLPSMMAAGDADQLEEALRDWVDPCNNLLYADRDGNIGYRMRGRLPVRAKANAWLPVPGWTGDGEWEGYVPFEEMPALRNPETGFIATANNRVVDDDYPHYVALEFAPGFRARRIIEHLHGATDLTPDDMSRIHADRVSIPAREFVRLLEAVKVTGDLDDVKKMLLAWDGDMDHRRAEPTIYSALRDAVLDIVLEDYLGEEDRDLFCGLRGSRVLARLKARLADLIREGDSAWLPNACDDWQSVMGQALGRAVSDLRARFDSAEPREWLWGEVHHTVPQHPLGSLFPDARDRLNPSQVPVHGDSDTVCASSYLAGVSGFTVAGTSVARYIFDLGERSRSSWVVPYGVSGHPSSPHYDDQLGPWSELKTLDMLSDPGEVAGPAGSAQVLSPRE